MDPRGWRAGPGFARLVDQGQRNTTQQIKHADQGARALFSLCAFVESYDTLCSEDKCFKTFLVKNKSLKSGEFNPLYI